MKKSIFNIYVPITSQEQAGRLKQVCLDNSLPIWDDVDAFTTFDDWVYFQYDRKVFWIRNNRNNKNQSTEQEFMELLKQWKDENS